MCLAHSNIPIIQYNPIRLVNILKNISSNPIRKPNNSNKPSTPNLNDFSKTVPIGLINVVIVKGKNFVTCEMLSKAKVLLRAMEIRLNTSDKNIGRYSLERYHLP